MVAEELGHLGKDCMNVRLPEQAADEVNLGVDQNESNASTWLLVKEVNIGSV